MITQAIRFVSTGLGGAEDKQLGTAWIDDDGELDYSNEAVQNTMAQMVRKFGPEKAFAFFLQGGANSSYVRSEPVDLADDPSLEAIQAMADQEDEAERAAGHDTTPGNDELHHYWTRGEGLAKWAESLKPWTTLVAHLTRHVGERKAKIFASRWFIEVFGYAAGSDKNRVAHGHPPRGHVVGPG